jgi:hypothetical protein
VIQKTVEAAPDEGKENKDKNSTDITPEEELSCLVNHHIKCENTNKSNPHPLIRDRGNFHVDKLRAEREGKGK